MTARVLIIDDEEGLCITLKKIFATKDWSASYSLDGENIPLILQSFRPNCVILDMKLGAKNGLDLIPIIHQQDESLPIIVLTAFESVKSAVEAMQKGAFHYLAKPFDNEELLAIVEKALQEHLTWGVDGDESRTGGLAEILGTSPGMVETGRLILAAAQTDVSVLLYGEPGVGKETCARLIHQKSSRASHPFVSFDTQAISADAFESELFGWLATAQGGTLFINEVGHLPLHLQARLLRFLETRETESSQDKQPLSVRIMAGTSLDLKSLCGKDAFRSDLFFHINQFPMHIPPLRERREDLLLLCKNMIRELNVELGKKLHHITTPALQALLCYPFPGNVRELKNALTRAMLAAKDNGIDLEHLPADILSTLPKNALKSGPLSMKEASKIASLQLEKTLILEALNQSGGHQGKASRLLQVTPRTLYNKMKEFGML